MSEHDHAEHIPRHLQDAHAYRVTFGRTSRMVHIRGQSSIDRDEEVIRRLGRASLIEHVQSGRVVWQRGMKKSSLGVFVDPPGNATIDLPRLLETKLLLQAGSGFGKSYALRRVLEQTHAGVQQFVIDPEGEFSTLRERHGYVVAAAKDGDVEASPRIAGLLARRLVETRVSAVLDISELKKPERRKFVRLFLEELMQLPRAMWTPLLVAIDEAHEFAPEQDEAESLDAVTDLATRGRKRGFSLIAATQRISKLSKDVAAELHNKLIGFASLDVDVKRAAYELGMTPSQALAELRQLQPGGFFAIGPAITPTIRRLQVGEVETTHPRPGTKKLQAPPKPTAEIIAVLPKLADLPKEAEAELRSLDEVRRELAKVRGELTRATKAQPAPIASREQIDAAEKRGATLAAITTRKESAATIARLERALEEAMKFIIEVHARDFAAKAGEPVDPEALEKAITAAVAKAMSLIESGQATRNRALVDLKEQAGKLIERVNRIRQDSKIRVAVEVRHNEPFTVSPPQPKRAVPAATTASASDLQPVQQRILDALAELEQIGAAQPPRELAAFMAGYSNVNSKGFANSIGALRSHGMISSPAQGGAIYLTDSGRAAAAPPERPRTAEELQARLVQMLGGASGRILEPLIKAYPNPLPRQEVAQEAGYGNVNSKGFANGIGRLRTLGFIDYPDRGSIVAMPVLFLESG